jgi:hypothetical protein
MKKYALAAIIIAGLIGLGNLSCKPPKPSENFYLRSCRTGKLIGPVALKSGHLLPSLDEEKYIIADPTDSELEVRKCLLGSTGYASQYIDCELADVIEAINKMLKHRLGNKAPSVRIESEDTWKPPLITIDITNEPAYDVLCNLADKAKCHVFIEKGVVILSQRQFKEISGKNPDSSVQ